MKITIEQSDHKIEIERDWNLGDLAFEMFTKQVIAELDAYKRLESAGQTSMPSRKVI